MVDKQDNKDFFTWLREDLAPELAAAQKSWEPYIYRFQQYATAINKALICFIEEHRDTLALWVELSKVYPKLEPHINNIISGLDDPELEIANDVIRVVHVIESIDLNKDPSTASLLDVISTDSFQNSLIDAYLNLKLDQDRLGLIKEALELHNKKYYAGSVCLLYGLLEGTITESFERAGYIIRTKGNIRAVKESGLGGSDKPLNGLVPKINHAITCKDELESYYHKMKTYELVSGDQNKTLPRERNAVLHGNSVTFNTERHSAQLILWLYSTILHVRILVI
ncbi:hypothetical protein ACEUCO_05330 [Aeromonas veronii]